MHWDALVATLERFELSHSDKVVPFIGELIPSPELTTKNVICFGSYSMRHVAKRNGWSPGVFDLFEQDAYVRERVREWQPHEAFVIDVCDTEAGLRIVELNTLNAAGFYAADVQKLVLALEEAFD